MDDGQFDFCRGVTIDVSLRYCISHIYITYDHVNLGICFNMTSTKYIYKRGLRKDPNPLRISAFGCSPRESANRSKLLVAGHNAQDIVVYDLTLNVCFKILCRYGMIIMANAINGNEGVGMCVSALDRVR